MSTNAEVHAPTNICVATYIYMYMCILECDSPLGHARVARTSTSIAFARCPQGCQAVCSHIFVSAFVSHRVSVHVHSHYPHVRSRCTYTIIIKVGLGDQYTHVTGEQHLLLSFFHTHTQHLVPLNELSSSPFFLSSFLVRIFHILPKNTPSMEFAFR
jgi:hypothetical protein